ncbi:MAG TPA: excinuclease ATPase subunit [Arenimonas sp.]|uniref:excinuclease ATPase subunit n=1 Tax=Arenimonas sp. TaxID=1872635 RepID=UPI002D7FEE1F|nr:excinuclease ATPase subunit [Arenimonas sp.]HEU0153707.1 excinuclease ATPase subunit [Arenimonas sp.]
MKSILSCLLAFALAGLLANTAEARDKRVQFDIASAIAAGEADGSLDGSVKFYFEGQATPRLFAEFGPANTNRKTNAVGKSEREACQWAMLGALVALQDAAKARGADAVVGLRSNFKREVFSSPTQYQCGAGRLMAGVALLGTYAKVADR